MDLYGHVCVDLYMYAYGVVYVFLWFRVCVCIRFYMDLYTDVAWICACIGMDVYMDACGIVYVCVWICILICIDLYMGLYGFVYVLVWIFI